MNDVQKIENTSFLSHPYRPTEGPLGIISLLTIQTIFNADINVLDRIASSFCIRVYRKLFSYGFIHVKVANISRKRRHFPYLFPDDVCLAFTGFYFESRRTITLSSSEALGSG